MQKGKLKSCTVKAKLKCMAISVLVSGKLGDLFHSLYVCHHVYKTRNEKSIVYMTDAVEPFENGLENTFNELYVPIMEDWCERFAIWNGEPIDIDTTQFRKSPYLYNACWSEIMVKTFFPNESYVGGAWINYAMQPQKGLLVVNRRYKNEFTPIIRQRYMAIIPHYPKRVFVGSRRDFDLFPLNGEFELFEPQTIADWLVTINNADLFIGNQSAPLAMASAMDTRRIAELLPINFPDGIHYRDESKYSSKFEGYIQ